MRVRQLVLREHDGAELVCRAAGARVLVDHDVTKVHDGLVLPLLGACGDAETEGTCEDRAQVFASLDQLGWAGERQRCTLLGVVGTSLDHHVL